MKRGILTLAVCLLPLTGIADTLHTPSPLGNNPSQQRMQTQMAIQQQQQQRKLQQDQLQQQQQQERQRQLQQRRDSARLRANQPTATLPSGQ